MKTAKDPRHLARKMALQTLFQWSSRTDFPLIENDTIPHMINDVYDSMNENQEQPLFHKEMAEELVKGVIDNRQSLDEIISESAPEWPIDQISKVDANVLRVSIFELLHRDETPVKVAIDEAVELAKEFGSDSSSKFVNGVLGTVVKKYVKR